MENWGVGTFFYEKRRNIMDYEIDSIDKKIILELQEDARTHYKEIAKKLKISEGTVRNRIIRLIDRDILKLQARVNPMALPNKIPALVGLNLEQRSQVEKMREIERIPGVTSVWNAIGRFDLFFEIMADSLNELNGILFEKDLNGIGGISHSETFILVSSQTKYFKLK
jgi:Lrp/AsnC family transcriptional regulator for asnA, asnC and gidA